MKSNVLVAVLALALLGQASPEEGVVPVGADGKPLNLGFELGTLKDWTATGNAFEKQPVRGNVVARRRGDMSSDHAGQHWIGGFEVAGDPPTGTLTSAPFRVTHPWASFLVAGGPHESTRAEIVRTDDKSIFFRAIGDETENLKRVAVDLQSLAGKEIFIRLVDEHTGHWGHLNFDDFRFHAEKPVAAAKQQPPAKPQLDTFKHAGLAPADAAKAMTVPDGFNVTLFAGEPDIHQPIAMAFDHRGRLWIAENHGYPIWTPPDKPGKDRIVILEDTDGDGRCDKQKVFVDNLNFVSGLEVGFGGAWVGAPPSLLFIPDRDGDDKPDGPPQVLLDGWEHQDTHETLNAFTWGPDGWLYGCHGVFTHSLVGKPGAPANERTFINCAIWRYHPTRHQFEMFAEGGSNQWGVDFDEHGQCFMTACVIPHLYHVIQGASYQRQGGVHVNPALTLATDEKSRRPVNLHIYDDIKTIADHRHYVGGQPHGGNNKSDSAGGGHAHAGAMIYLGDNWPAEYRGKLLFNNIHGARINMDVLERKGSGFIGRHGGDPILTNDRWSQILNLRAGPDGAVYMIDWYDKQQCHTMKPTDHDRTNGRIFKVAYKQPSPANGDVAASTDPQLSRHALSNNEWLSRHARRVAQERQAIGLRAPMEKIAAESASIPQVLRALWTVHVVGGLSGAAVDKGLSHASEVVRAWTIQLTAEGRMPSDAVRARYLEMAEKDPSPVVRLYLASACQRLSHEARLPILEKLIAHEEDAQDQNLPLMYWYAIEPMAAADMKAAALLMAKTKIPRLREFISRRLTAK